VLQKIEEKRTFFMQEAAKRGLKDAEALWQRYRTDVLMRI